MRRILTVALAAAAIGCVPALAAARADVVAKHNATTIAHAVQVSYWGGWYGGSYRPACPWGYHYTCRAGPYGYRHCACWPNW